MINLESICDSFDSIQLDPVERLPPELISHIFSYLNLSALGASSCVNKRWCTLASQLSIWKNVIHKKLAFGNNQWAKCFGPHVVKDEDDSEEFKSLPVEEFILDSRNFYSQFGGKVSLMLVRFPKTFDGRPFTLGILNTLSKQVFGICLTSLRRESLALINEKCPIDQSRWVAMTTSVLPESLQKTVNEKMTFVNNLTNQSLNNYTVPTLLEAVTCVLTRFYWKKTHLFGSDPPIFTCCSEKLFGFQSAIGGFSQNGLTLTYSLDLPNFGIAVMKKF